MLERSETRSAISPSGWVGAAKVSARSVGELRGSLGREVGSGRLFRLF